MVTVCKAQKGHGHGGSHGGVGDGSDFRDLMGELSTGFQVHGIGTGEFDG